MARDFAKGLYNSKAWAGVRGYCLRRDRYLCVVCGDPAEEVHHIIHLTPDNINDEKITLNPDNLISLCRSCHFEKHKGEHAKGLQKNSDYEYEFDENGFLISKENSPLCF